MAFAGMKDGKTLHAAQLKYGLNGFDGRPGERQIIAHFVHITAYAAKVGLHVYYDQGGVVFA